MKQKKQKLITATVIVWAMVTAIGAFLYALIETRSPMEEPVFQSMWGWHLLMFAIYVLPICLIVLAVTLWIEHKLLSSKKANSE
jgi:uncharacterized membrane protein